MSFVKDMKGTLFSPERCRVRAWQIPAVMWYNRGGPKLSSAKALLDRDPHPTEQQIRQAIVGDLCRCTGYAAIVRTIRDVVERT